MTIEDACGLIAPFTPKRIDESKRAFQTAQPFPHLVVDDFLTTEGLAATRAYPEPDWPHWRRFLDAYQKEKRVCDDITVIPPPLAALIRECNEPAFLEVLQRVTGIDHLLPDPYLGGGGLHCSGAGGVLAPHTDFHLYEKLNLYRAVNVLIYLNDDWTAEDGGGLGLYRRGETAPATVVTPTLGRAVIFRTDDRSIHGFADPVAPGRWRRSVALYYYTARETPGFSGDTNTRWQTRGPRLTGARLAAFEALIFLSRVFSKLAHEIDPNTRPAG